MRQVIWRLKMIKNSFLCNHLDLVYQGLALKLQLTHTKIALKNKTQLLQVFTPPANSSFCTPTAGL